MDRSSVRSLALHWDISPTSYLRDAEAFFDSYTLRISNHDGRVFLQAPIYALSLLVNLEATAGVASNSIPNVPGAVFDRCSGYLPQSAADLLVFLLPSSGRVPDEDYPDPDHSRSPFYVDHPLQVRLFLDSPGYSSRGMIFVPGVGYPDEIMMKDNSAFSRAGSDPVRV